MSTLPACKTPCPTCPFRRTVEPGQLGGSPVETFIGQVNGFFWLPCHERTNYSDPNWKTNLKGIPQCAGAATMRTHIGWQWTGHRQLATLPADHATVFSSFAEFFAHHRRTTIYHAQQLLETLTPDVLTKHEMHRSGVAVHR